MPAACAESSGLDGRTGLLAIAPDTSPVTAAFALLAGVECLVIDLRQGLGGAPETVALICGYLLGDCDPDAALDRALEML
jgi:hypothetical protein